MSRTLGLTDHSIEKVMVIKGIRTYIPDKPVPKHASSSGMVWGCFRVCPGNLPYCPVSESVLSYMKTDLQTGVQIPVITHGGNNVHTSEWPFMFYDCDYRPTFNSSDWSPSSSMNYEYRAGWKPLTPVCCPNQDVSCNEVTALPRHIGRLKALRELNVRRNLLCVLPEGTQNLN